ncbi:MULTISPECIES: hypothetical protein [Mycobacterium]|uniref:Uncharacterized protein n=1 Tax=Mycobacterium kiyosense TaxID=2871094 RepID=A0AA37PXA7_9MYCO|nr:MULTISPECIES: hypothetical protein [Mycobacterium]GLB83123.1 hypothetical protein SRL2020028_23790 [Mycobacterium kiyosense]GLB92390.1 hypothetical protein SRL2020130_52070 [Mycobacterium kiyosense]GLB96612.1 hypothetical protein SRL2020226_33880 [Mycobacterium kiyosense]GLC16654.1 hypothetical protein SRL2020448_52570 [Mycobacterium kiyosense]GLD09184.1 hypothetical protein Mkiyose1383_55100 [Mycobacterium kiyosense]
MLHASRNFSYGIDNGLTGFPVQPAPGSSAVANPMVCWLADANAMAVIPFVLNRIPGVFADNCAAIRAGWR